MFLLTCSVLKTLFLMKELNPDSGFNKTITKMNFELSEEQNLIRETVRDFAEREMKLFEEPFF